MLNTLLAGSSLEAAKIVTDKLPDSTLESARNLYKILLALSFDVIEDKAYRAIPTHVTYHSSLSLVASVAGINRITAWRSLSRLKNLGLVDWRSHKCMFRGRASNSGTVFQVRLNPTQGTRAKLSYQDMKHEYKDLERAARCKRLASTMLQHIQALESQLLRYEVLKAFSLKPYTDKNPDIQYRFKPSLEALLSVPYAQGAKIAEVVNLAAVSLASSLQDTKGTDFYRKLLWALKRRLDASGDDRFHTVYLQADRIVKADIPEWEGLRKPGALFTKRLKAFEWYAETMRNAALPGETI